MATSTHAHLDVRLASLPAGTGDGGKTYKAVPNKWCKGQNDLFESKLGAMKSAAECQKKCSENPKCVSAEWYGSHPTQCDTSSTCTTKNMVDAPKVYGVIFFVKQMASVTTAGHGTDPPLTHTTPWCMARIPLSNDPLALRIDAAPRAHAYALPTHPIPTHTAYTIAESTKPTDSGRG